MNTNLNDQNKETNQNLENQAIDFNPIPEPMGQPVVDNIQSSENPSVSIVEEQVSPQVETQPTINPEVEQNISQVETNQINPAVEPTPQISQEEIKMESVSKPLNIPLIILLGVVVIVVGIFLGKLLYDTTAGKDVIENNDPEVVEPTTAPNEDNNDSQNTTPTNPTENILNQVGLKNHTELLELMTQVIAYNTTAANIIIFKYNTTDYLTVQDIALLNTELSLLDVSKSFEIIMEQDASEIVTKIIIEEYNQVTP